MTHSSSSSNITPPVHPLRAAGILTGTYLTFGIIYIVTSSRLAAQLSVSIKNMEMIELCKGILFIVLTGLLLFGFSLRLFRQAARREQELQMHREALLTAERRATASLFAASIAHDIRNVLTVCNCAISVLPGKNEPSFGHLSTACNRLNHLSSQLTEIGQETHTHEFSGIDLMQIIREATELTSEHTKARQCRLLIEGPVQLELSANPRLLHHMLMHLLLNAADAGCNRGTILIRVISRLNNVAIEVHDNGPGIPTSKRETMFRPFYTEKSDNSGLGLLAVQAFVKTHHGDIEILPSGLGGACFRVNLPVCTQTGTRAG